MKSVILHNDDYFTESFVKPSIKKYENQKKMDESECKHCLRCFNLKKTGRFLLWSVDQDVAVMIQQIQDDPVRPAESCLHFVLTPASSIPTRRLTDVVLEW